MFFIVEDGSGLPNANSYTSVNDAEDYITLYEDDIQEWMDLDEERKEVLLIRATRFLDGMLRWRGSLLKESQSLLWPRQKLSDNNGRVVTGVPNAIKDAVAALAFTSLKEGLSTYQEKIARSDFGDTSDVYATPIVVGNTVVQDLIKSLTLSGYGRNRTTIVKAVRG